MEVSKKDLICGMYLWEEKGSMDFGFIADVVGSVALAYAAVRIVPVIAATVLVCMDKMDANSVKDLFKNNKRGF